MPVKDHNSDSWLEDSDAVKEPHLQETHLSVRLLLEEWTGEALLLLLVEGGQLVRLVVPAKVIQLYLHVKRACLRQVYGSLALGVLVPLLLQRVSDDLLDSTCGLLIAH